MKKRKWFKRSSVILSAVVSIAAPMAKTGLPIETKGSKPCKKSKSPHSSVADDEDADASPPFGDHPPQLAVDGCCATPDELVLQSTRQLRARPPMARKHTASARYVWKNDISTTVFWIGETPTENNPTPNHASSWDKKWAVNYGGFDNPDPKARNGFLPSTFKPKQNPFYVALPYNDMTLEGHKEEAEEIIPWYEKMFTSKWKSVCKGRWIAIRKGDRVCYAQWEDAGPFTTTDSAYVFGDARPKPNANRDAGLDVSPAVRDYLGLDGHDKTDWKFVEFEDVPLGPWAEHGENNDFVMNRKTGSDGRSVAARSHREGSGGKRGTRSSS